MRLFHSRIPYPVLFAFLLVTVSGCLPVEVVDDPESQPPENEAPVTPPEQPPRAEPPEEAPPEEPPPPPTIPKVNLTESLSDTCLVGVGDPIPDAELADLEGNKYSIREVLGEKLTVLLFWNSENMHSVVELEDLARDFAGPLAERGGRIVAVNTGETPEKAAKATKEAGVSLLVLVDPERTYFEKLATERLPRTYVLDAEGTFLWFDLEYSRTTRRHLEQTIDVVLAGPPNP